MAVLCAKVCFEKTAFENNPHSGRETRSPLHVVNIYPPTKSRYPITSNGTKHIFFRSTKLPGFHAAPGGDLSRPQLNARSQIQSMFLSLWNLPKAVRINGGGRQRGQGRNR